MFVCKLRKAWCALREIVSSSDYMQAFIFLFLFVKASETSLKQIAKCCHSVEMERFQWNISKVQRWHEISNKRKLKTSTTTKVLKWKLHLMCSRNLVDSKTRLGHKKLPFSCARLSLQKNTQCYQLESSESLNEFTPTAFTFSLEKFRRTNFHTIAISETVDMTTSCCYLKRIRFFHSFLLFAQLKTR